MKLRQESEARLQVFFVFSLFPRLSSGKLFPSLCSRSGRVQLWDSGSAARRTPLRRHGVGSHHLHRPAPPQEEAEEEEGQRAGPAGNEEAAVSPACTSPAGH